jgi:Recombination endonuclease VII
MRLCLEQPCNKELHARGYCKSHYNKHMKLGTFTTSEPKEPPHRLTDKNLETKTATCSVCGPTPMRFNKDYWFCVTKRRKNEREKPRKGAKYQYSYGNGNYLGLDEITKARLKLQTEQNNLCAICSAPAKQNKTLSIDHCHETGKIRGLLCSKCNMGLGLLGDTAESLRKALQYLEG